MCSCLLMTVGDHVWALGSGCRAKLFLLLVLPAALGTQFAAL